MVARIGEMDANLFSRAGTSSPSRGMLQPLRSAVSRSAAGRYIGRDGDLLAGVIRFSRRRLHPLEIFRGLNRKFVSSHTCQG
jgi:hypothetical protein